MISLQEIPSPLAVPLLWVLGRAAGPTGPGMPSKCSGDRDELCGLPYLGVLGREMPRSRRLLFFKLRGVNVHFAAHGRRICADARRICAATCHATPGSPSATPSRSPSTRTRRALQLDVIMATLGATAWQYAAIVDGSGAVVHPALTATSSRDDVQAYLHYAGGGAKAFTCALPCASPPA